MQIRLWEDEYPSLVDWPVPTLQAWFPIYTFEPASLPVILGVIRSIHCALHAKAVGKDCGLLIEFAL